MTSSHCNFSVGIMVTASYGLNEPEPSVLAALISAGVCTCYLTSNYTILWMHKVDCKDAEAAVTCFKALPALANR